MGKNGKLLSEPLTSSGKISYEKMLSQEGECITHVVGDSMLPLLKNRKSIVRVISVAERKPRKKDVVLYKHGDKYILHRILYMEDSAFIIRGDNNSYLERVPIAEIIGVMDGFYWRPFFPYISSRSVLYLCYVILLPVIRATRRMLIWVKRIMLHSL